MRQDGYVLAITLCSNLRLTITFMIFDGIVKNHRDLRGTDAVSMKYCIIKEDIHTDSAQTEERRA